MAMMKLWIDVLTPKQALFTRAMIDRAPSKFKLSVTTRDYSELNKFAKKIGLSNATVLGRHGGGDIIEKLKASVARENELIGYSLKGDFDASFSFISPEAARVSFGKALPHYICSDAPHAFAACRLAVPLCSKLFSPFPIKKASWTRYGLKDSQVLNYRALDPWAWLLSKKEHKSNNSKRKKEKGRESRNLIVIRLEESFASYMQAGLGISGSIDPLLNLISSNYEILLIPRYKEQRTWARKQFGNRVTIPEDAIDGPEVISEAKLVIGGGGTMTQEAAILGVPNISYFPSAKLEVFENYYFPKGLSIKASTTKELIGKASRLIQNLDEECDKFSARAKRLTHNFEDPVKFIFNNLS